MTLTPIGKSLSAFLLTGLCLTAAQAQNIAVVNGRPIPKERADLFIKELERQGQQSSPELASLVRQELVDREVLLQEAERRGLPAKAETRFQIETARTQILIQSLVQDELSRNPVTDDEISQEYKRMTAGQSTEYRARHILVESRDQARAVIGRLKKGEAFEQLAKQLSKDPGSAGNGGDLDWASADTFVEPFSKAMASLKKGSLTTEPVQTQFGWHVIRLDDVRETAPPPLAEVRTQIVEGLQRQKLSNFQQSLRGKAEIK